jgi:hypothetical protein
LSTMYTLSKDQLAEINDMVSRGSTVTYATETVVPQIKETDWKYTNYPNQLITEADLKLAGRNRLARMAWGEVVESMRNGRGTTEIGHVTISDSGIITVDSYATHEQWIGATRLIRPDWSVDFHAPLNDELEFEVHIRRPTVIE